MIDNGNCADVEVFIRRSGGEDDLQVWEASYEGVAKLHTRTIVERVGLSGAEPGIYEIGLRERGDEQHTQRVEITPLQSDPGDSANVFKNHAAAVLEHWRQ